MKISELKESFPEIEIIKDGDFNTTGSNDCVHDKEILSYIMDKKYISDMSGCISCVITAKELAEYMPEGIGLAFSEKPRETFFKIHNLLSDKFTPARKKTVVGKNCRISQRAVISDVNVVIGDNVLIEDNVIIKKGVVIGNGCVLRSGVVLGGEGFFFSEINGVNAFVKHYGNVILNDFVEIQYASVVDRAIWSGDSTIIGVGSKIDNLIHIAHGTKIGANCKIAAGVIIGGNVSAGDNIFFGLNSTIKNHIKIGSNSVIGMGAVVLKDVEDGRTVVGNPARGVSEKIHKAKE